MTTFETDGFLSAEIAGYEHDVETFYPKRLEIARKANRLVHQVIYSAKVYNQELVDLLLAALLARADRKFKAPLTHRAGARSLLSKEPNAARFEGTQIERCRAAVPPRGTATYRFRSLLSHNSGIKKARNALG